jgi:hypothetical protein
VGCVEQLGGGGKLLAIIKWNLSLNGRLVRIRTVVLVCAAVVGKGGQRRMSRSGPRHARKVAWLLCAAVV